MCKTAAVLPELPCVVRPRFGAWSSAARGLLLALALTAGATALPSIASAQDTLDALVARGLAQYKKGEFAASAVTFTRAYALEPKGRILFNVARAHEKAGNVAEAVASYKKYLEASDTEPPLEARAREALVKLESQKDGQKDPQKPPAAAPVAASAPPSPEPATPAAVSPQPAPSAPSPLVATASAPPSAPQASPAPRTLGWVLAGTGAVAVGVGFGLGAWANGTASREKRETDLATKTSLRDAAYGRAIAADVTMGAGVLLVGAGLAYLLWPRNKAPVTVGANTLSFELPL